MTKTKIFFLSALIVLASGCSTESPETAPYVPEKDESRTLVSESPLEAVGCRYNYEEENVKSLACDDVNDLDAVYAQAKALTTYSEDVSRMLETKKANELTSLNLIHKSLLTYDGLSPLFYKAGVVPAGYSNLIYDSETLRLDFYGRLNTLVMNDKVSVDDLFGKNQVKLLGAPKFSHANELVSEFKAHSLEVRKNLKLEPADLKMIEGFDAVMAAIEQTLSAASSEKN